MNPLEQLTAIMTFHYESPADYIARWKRVGPLLNKIGRQELREMSDREHLHSIASVLALANPQAEKRTTSGLVELQKLFARARR